MYTQRAGSGGHQATLYRPPRQPFLVMRHFCRFQPSISSPPKLQTKINQNLHHAWPVYIGSRNVDCSLAVVLSGAGTHRDARNYYLDDFTLSFASGHTRVTSR